MKRIGLLFLKKELALLAVLVALFTGFSFLVDGFFDWFNLCEQVRYWGAVGLIAIPMTFIIATGGIDLSVASTLALASVILGLLYDRAGWPIWAAAGAAILAGGLCGALNGFVSSYLRVPPLVVTLATMILFRGLAMGLTRGASLGHFPDSFLWLASGDVFSFSVGTETVYIPVPFLVLMLGYVVGAVLLRKTRIGRYTEAIGENVTAASFAAIRVRLLAFWLYTAAGLVCGVAALFHTALYAAAKANTAQGMELEAIACVVVGGTRISGGDASIWGTLLGLFIIGILRYGLRMAGVDSEYIIIVVGALLILAAVLNEQMSRWTQKNR